MNPSAKPTEASKDSKKKGRGLLTIKSATSKVLEQKSPEQSKSDHPSTTQKGPKDTLGFFPELPPQKRPKLSDSRLPPGKFLNSHFTLVEPVSLAYPSDLPDPLSEDQLTITEIRSGTKFASPLIIDPSVSTF